MQTAAHPPGQPCVMLTRDQAAVVYYLCGMELQALDGLTVTKARERATAAFRRPSSVGPAGVEEYAQELRIVANLAVEHAKALSGGQRPF